MSDSQDAASDGSSSLSSVSPHDADSPSCGSSPGESPMSLAANSGHTDGVVPLTEASDDDLNAVDDDGNMSLTHAARNGYTRIVEIILRDEKDAVNPRDYQCAFFAAAKGGHAAVLHLLLETFDLDVNATTTRGSTALHLAASNGCAEVVAILLEQNNIDVNKRDRSNSTALGKALANKHENVVELLFSRDDLAWGLHLENSIEETAHRGEYGQMDSLLASECAAVNNILDPLSWAAVRGLLEVLRKLVLRGAKINAKNRRGRTPLSWAAQCGQVEAVQMLLDFRADANIADHTLQTPFLWAMRKGDEGVMNKLIPADTSTLIMLACRGDLDSIKYMLSHGSDPDQRDGKGRTALHLATSLGRLDIARALMSEGADPNIEDYSGMTPIQVALSYTSTDLVRELLERGANTAGTRSEDWRHSFGRRDGDVALLCREPGGEQHLHFPEVVDDIWELFEEHAKDETFLFLWSDEVESSVWVKRLYQTPDETELTANNLQIDLYDRNNESPNVSVALWLPIDQLSSDSFSRCQGGEVSRIMWFQEWHEGERRMVYLSTLPYGSIPNDRVDLFRQFLIHANTQWLELCRRAGERLSQRRIEQLKSQGLSPEMINDLAKDAQKLAGLRLSLASQISEARKFMDRLKELDGPNESQQGVLEYLKRDFEPGIQKKLDELEQTARDLLQIEFAWSSIREARTATKLGQNVMLLTYVSIFYLPLGFCAALWAIPNISDISTRLPFIVTACCVSLLTLLVTFNMERIASWFQEGHRYCRTNTPRDLLGKVSTNLPKKVPRSMFKVPRDLFKVSREFLGKISQWKEKKKVENPSHP